MVLTNPTLVPMPEDYLLEEDEMSESYAQFHLIKKFTALLEYQYEQEGWMIVGNLELRHPAIRNNQGKITPDLSIFIGIAISAEERRHLTSWQIGPNRPAPPVVLEISSRSNWLNDIGDKESDKPAIYGRIGVREYYAYDPNDPPVWENVGGRRLLGWRYEADRQPRAIKPNEQGWLWSFQLGSWLVPAGDHIELYDGQRRKRLTAQEAANAAKAQADQRLADETKAKAETEQRLADEIKAKAETEQRLADEAAARKAETEARQAAELTAEAEIAELRRQLEALRRSPPPN